MISVGDKKVTSVHNYGAVFVGSDKVFPTSATVKELLSEGYATYSGGVIQILSTCPYKLEEIEDFIEYLTNESKIVAGTNNTFVWRQSLPNGWTVQQIADCYNNNILKGYNGYPGSLFTGINMSAIQELKLETNGTDTWIAVGQFLFGGRNQTKSTCPQKLIVKLASKPSTLNCAFHGMGNVKEIVLDFTTDCLHDMSGAFEYCNNIIKVNAAWQWNTVRTCGYTFENCFNLKEIPLTDGTTDRFNWINEWYPRFDNYRGWSSIHQTFNNCYNLESIKPVMNMNAIGDNGVYNSFTNTSKLTDVRFKNLNNRDWDFTRSETYIPNMDSESIAYIINNLASIVSLSYAKNKGINSIGGDEGMSIYWQVDENGNRIESSVATDSLVLLSDNKRYAITNGVTSKPVYIKDVDSFELVFSTKYVNEFLDSSDKFINIHCLQAARDAILNGWVIKFGDRIAII